MSAFLDRLFPHSTVSQDNPVFAQGIKQIKWLRTKKGLLGYSVILTYFVLVACVAWFIIRDANHSLEGTRNLLTGLFVGAVLAALATDIYTAKLVRSTPLSPDSASTSTLDEVKAYDALVQIRAWRIMAFEVSLRIT